MVRESAEEASELSSFIRYKQDRFWRSIKKRLEPTHLHAKTQNPKTNLSPIPNLQPRWSTIKSELGIKCSLSIEDLTGGRILTINHMSSLLSNHSKFEWENYGVEWEIDHIIPFEVMDKHLVSDRYKLNNWSNLAPKTTEQNKKERKMKMDAARAAKTEASRPAETKASRPAETEAARHAETEAARPTEPESQSY
jgi:hypothetical protein